jgi:hypothetical protein
MGFYRRHGKNRPELAEKFNQGREKWFYNTFKEFDITIEPIPPNKGIAISSYNERLKAFGIAKDAVIVAVDGLKVRNLDEFTGIRSTDFRDEMTITVFQGNRYQTLKGKVVNRQFGVGMVNFPK